VTPLNPGSLIPPYKEEQKPLEKLKVTYQALRRSVKRRCRLTALTNAYFLGKILDEAEDTKQEFRLKRELTSHYVTISEKAYILFELDPAQILRTSRLDIRDLRRTRKQDIIKIANDKIEFFVGTQSLEEENC
jgi:hypothetical protein